MDTGGEVSRTLGAYQIVAELARGGMATVYRAVQPNLGRFVALKVLSAELSHDPDFVTRFQHEARVAARLEHPNIVPIYDVGQADGIFYIAMRLVPGRSLADIISSDGPLPLDRVRHLLTQVASALDYAHRQGVIHRDVKPSNMLVEDNDHVSLADSASPGPPTRAASPASACSWVRRASWRRSRCRASTSTTARICTPWA